MTERKVFAGQRVKHLRTALGLNQATMARELGISGSYLNLVERNQRPLTTQLVLKLAETYDLDLRDLRGDRETRRVAELTEILTDPAFGKMPPPAAIADIVNGYPDIAAALVSIYGAYRKTSAAGQLLPDSAASDDRQPVSRDERFPVEEVRDYFHARNNYIASLDDEAETFHAELAENDDLFPALRQYLRDQHQVRVTVLPIHAMPDAQRRFDRHNRRLFLSEMLSVPSRTFQVAVQVALLSYGKEIDRLVADAKLSGEDANRLFRIGLANHFAGALMMPYERFLEAATATRYDIDVLANRFGASIEQVAHRLTTLQRSERRGVPFFLLRLDNAGNISKRFSAGGFAFARFGGTCPRWRVHDAFATPGETIVQPVELPDGTRYLTISRTVEAMRGRYPLNTRKLAISLGCEISHAAQTIYADGLDLTGAETATPIGVTCRVCERTNCAARAFPPMTRPLTIDASRKGFSAFEFGEIVRRDRPA
ncbi:MAG TPA: short-chain fatty acyl-CoA regulator family protein [Rhizomicrobium sp.]|nr:short-chain fatty acyl-CoA regulator family protein [Rhizomicrobium sp.]